VIEHAAADHAAADHHHLRMRFHCSQFPASERAPFRHEFPGASRAPRAGPAGYFHRQRSVSGETSA
jgi:hypothetical protein